MAHTHREDDFATRAALAEQNVAVFSDVDHNRTSWGAIFAGAISGLALYLILGLIGLAAGIGVIDPAEESQPLAGVPTGVGLWWSVSALASFFAAGLIAGRLAGWPRNLTGALHGLTVGALTVLFIAYIATSTVGSLVSGAAGAVSGLFQGAERRDVMLRVAQPDLLRQAIESSGQSGQGQSGGLTRSQVQNLINARMGNGSGQTGANAGQQSSGGQQPAASGGFGSGQGDYLAAGLLLQQAMQTIRQEGRQLFGNLVSPGERRRVANQVEATYADLLETPGDAGRDVQELFRFLLSNEGVLGPQDRERALRLLRERLGVEEAQAERILDRWQDRYEQAVGNLQNLVNDAGSQLSSLARRQDARFDEAASQTRQSIQKTANQVGEAVSETAAEVGDRANAAARQARDAIRPVASRQETQRTAEIAQAAYEDIVDSPGDALRDLEVMFDKLFGRGGVWTEEDVAELRTLLGDSTGLDKEAVNRLVDRWQNRYQEAATQVQETYQVARKETIEAADTTLDTIAATAGWASFALVLALAASTLGGMLGRPESVAEAIEDESRNADDEDIDLSSTNTRKVEA